MKALNNLKQKALLLLLLVAAGVVKAQSHEFAPVGAEWYYERFYREGWNLTGIAYDRFRSLRTVEINGWECKEIELYQHLDCHGVVNPYTELRYITQEGDQVYEVEDGQRFLLYDFGKEVGEYWLVPKYEDTVFVTNVSYIVIEDGSERKVLETETASLKWHIYDIIEGIGMAYSLFPFNQELDGTPCVEGLLRCYSENGTPLIVWSNWECDYEIVAIDEHSIIENIVMNTIVGDLLRIHFSETEGCIKQINIIDNMGRVIYTNKTVDKDLDISFSNNPKGVYLIQILIGSQMINKIIVKT